MPTIIPPSRLAQLARPQRSPKALDAPVMPRAGHTELPQELMLVPWFLQYEPGMGVDVLSGLPSPEDAVRAVSVVTSGKRSAESTSAILRDATDLTKLAWLTEPHSSSVFRFGSDIHALDDRLSAIRISSTELTVFAQYRSCYGWESSEELTATARARDLAATDPAAFRHVYGDYILSGGQRRSAFTALFNLQAADIPALAAALDNMAAATLLSDIGIDELSRCIDEARADVKVHVFMSGVPGAPPPETGGGISGVMRALEWFKRNERGTFDRANLLHYSAVPGLGCLPKSLPLAHSAFAAVDALARDLRRLCILMEFCPDLAGAWEVRTTVERLRLECEDDMHRLVEQDERRADIAERVRVLRVWLEDIHARYRLFLALSALSDKDPRGIQHGLVNMLSWSGGLAQSPAGYAIDLQKATFEVTGSLTDTIGQWMHIVQTVSFPVPPGRVIVGWNMRRDRKTLQKKAWRFASHPVIFSTTARITFRWMRFAPTRWSVELYHAPADLFPWVSADSKFLGESPTKVTEDFASSVHDLLKDI